MGWFILIVVLVIAGYYYFFSDWSKERQARKEFADTMTAMFAQEFINGTMTRNIKFISDYTTKSSQMIGSGKRVLLMIVTNNHSFSNEEAKGLITAFLAVGEISRTLHVLKFDAIWIQDQNGNHGSVHKLH